MSKKSTVRKRIVSLCCALSLTGFLFIGGTDIKVSAAATQQTFTGYVIDEDCFAIPAVNPGSHGKGCLSMKSCASSGYGIAVPQSDGTYRFAFLDGTISTASADKKSFADPAATGAQKAAYDIITASVKPKAIAITVTGTLRGNTATSPDGDLISYPVITVNTIAEKTDTLPTAAENTAAIPAVVIPASHPKGWSQMERPASQTLQGYIIDEDCFSPKTNPGEESKGCLSMTSCASSGYGIAVQQSDKSYKFYFFDGTVATANGMKDFALPAADGGQKAAYDLIKATSKKDHVYITVTGVLKGNEQTSPSGDKISYPVFTIDAASLKEAAAPIDHTSSKSSGSAVSSSKAPVQNSSTVPNNPHTGDSAAWANYLPLISVSALLAAIACFLKRRETEHK